jgi:hypothetical protein
MFGRVDEKCRCETAETFPWYFKRDIVNNCVNNLMEAVNVSVVVVPLLFEHDHTE